MEKIKDVVYQISDILFGLIVLLAVILIFTFQLYGWFNIDMPQSIARFAPNSASLNTYTADNVSASAAKVPADKKDTAVSSSDVKPDPVSSSDTSGSEETSESGIPSADVQLRNIVIAPGSTSSSIGNALYENNIIKSVEDFKSRLSELNLETKIKAGTFRIPQNAPLDEVIRVITS